MINNAAVQRSASWMEFEAAEIEAQVPADLVSPLLFCRHAARVFQAQKWGRIVNISSIQGRRANPKMLPYSMSKAALDNMTMALARDLAKDNITVNAIAPGYFNTWRNRAEFSSEAEIEKRGEWVPLGRVGQPRDCGGLALLLCSEAGSYMTGQIIYVDGGISSR